MMHLDSFAMPARLPALASHLCSCFLTPRQTTPSPTQQRNGGLWPLRARRHGPGSPPPHRPPLWTILNAVLPRACSPRCLLRLWLGVVQNFALNVAEHGFKISVNNRSHDKVDTTVRRAQEELGDKVGNLTGCAPGSAAEDLAPFGCGVLGQEADVARFSPQLQGCQGVRCVPGQAAQAHVPRHRRPHRRQGHRDIRRAARGGRHAHRRRQRVVRSPSPLAPSPRPKPQPPLGGLRLTASVSGPGTRTPSAVPLTWPSRTRASCTWRWA